MVTRGGHRVSSLVKQKTKRKITLSDASPEKEWKKTRESDLAKHAFSLAYDHYLTLNFHTLGRPDRLLSGVRTSFFFKKPPPEL